MCQQRRTVKHRFGADLDEKRIKRRCVTNVSNHSIETWMCQSRRQQINAGNLMTVFQQMIYQERTEETGAARNQIACQNYPQYQSHTCR